ncbi:endonuclease/exonuclease/phosphatase family metal-dependent hydrolase [Tepidimonas ignava]|uniref:Endonuclease/Exonuclease/phosphatase family protein n=2 Tax=Tepidimonas ignava TaxID=114249 RepID=A0A4R3L878_9BURK|nr:endonuclease/exonuclease/phosphatase family metal-dependent hydrolase [Tepidimonas ignava]TSE19367.1 Endonuclease/Exonuclease/phosphatase family protein [Tepidimonas ignava]
MGCVAAPFGGAGVLRDNATPMDGLRVATYNIHKGVQGVGPLKRLEVHNLAHAVAALGADVVCLQEVRAYHRRLQRRFGHWPVGDQAQFLAPPGYHAVYRTNAVTRHGEHGNALLSRYPVLHHAHRDVSDHRLEQRGLLHVTLAVPRGGQTVALHVVVVHLGLIHASRVRQVRALGEYLAQAVPPAAPLVVAGDFNDWGQRLHAPLAALGLRTAPQAHVPTYPARWPLLALDRVYARGLRVVALHAPHGPGWARWSDHLPLVAQLQWA